MVLRENQPLYWTARVPRKYWGGVWAARGVWAFAVWPFECVAAILPRREQVMNISIYSLIIAVPTVAGAFLWQASGPDNHKEIVLAALGLAAGALTGIISFARFSVTRLDAAAKRSEQAAERHEELTDRVITVLRETSSIVAKFDATVRAIPRVCPRGDE